MPKVKHSMPRPSRQKGQRSLDLPEWLYRVIPPWNNPANLLSAEVWRQVVARQPIAVDCREFLISSFLSLDWKIEPKDSDQRDELKDEIDYYTDFFTYTGDYHYDELIEWIGKDLLDIPFGAGAELGRIGDKPDGKVVWIEPLDGGTLFPTYSKKWPVGQMVRQVPMDSPVIFPKHAINRIYYSPRTELKLRGWGMPPPEKIYLALELINRGDVYYANLLLDTPEAGILDLGDMSKESAEEWIKSFRSLLGGIDPMKIPVLYEHNNEVKFIPFGQPPTELMFDKITAKYASIVAGGYGISLSDIGIQVAASGGETLAGSIRQERKTRRTGFSKFKIKMIAFFNFMLPDTLEYVVIDNDEEQAVATGRALLAGATALNQLVEMGALSRQEARLQLLASGLITISIPEKLPSDAVPAAEANADERPGSLGKPVAPSSGGQGEVLPRSDVISKEVHRVLDFANVQLETAISDIINPLAVEVKSVLEMENGEVAAWQDWHDEILWGDMLEEIPELSRVTLDHSRKHLNWIYGIDPINLSDDDIYDEFFSDLPKYESQIKARIFDIIQEIDKNLKRDIQNVIIAGTRKALINTDIIAKSLDENEILVDNDAVSYVRRELQTLEKNIISEFASRLAEEVKQILEENKNGSTT